MTTLICDCNRTMPLAADALGEALGEKLALHSTLCRREAGSYEKAVRGDSDVVVACTQEKRLFGELGAATEGAVAPVRFVNIRETGGWSRDASQAMPKIAALLAAAHLPEPDPVPTVTYKSAGRLLIIGPLDRAEQAGALLDDVLNVTLFSQGPGARGGAQVRRFPTVAGRLGGVTGWLGAFEVQWTQDNPIDLDLCTRCNACITACSEGAVGLDYQMDPDRCRNHRDCAASCTVAGAIDFSRPPETYAETFDLILDLGEQPVFTRHAPPQGYFRWTDNDPATLLRLRDMVGEFEKPKFFDYKQKLCAHSRNGSVGCDACVQICSAQAISSDVRNQQIKVNPNLCVGCGACTTVCPSGALTYSYPRSPDQGARLRTLLSTYASAGGRDAVLLLHSQEAGQGLVEALGRQARLGRAHGVPANVIPVALWHTASLGADLWLSAVAYGATQVVVLTTAEEAPQYLDGLQAQMDVAQAVLNGLGYAGRHLHLRHAADVSELDAQLQALAAQVPQSPRVAARHAVAPEKRSTLELALDHLIAHAPAPLPEAIVMPAGQPGAGSPFGGVKVNRDTCTLCMSCVSACPSGALLDNTQTPQLRFLEKNCVQCGLCATTCPEDAIELVPRLLLTPQRKEAVVVNETQPFHCVRCNKPFGTVKAIDAMVGRLAGHAMFQGAALERLKMCSDCRVIDMYSSENEVQITRL
ncbi:4Fe-4S binding protein [Bordetella genomosp. 13]|nr:4Fe-4S binding protein [Bordetella genomosp. 13]